MDETNFSAELTIPANLKGLGPALAFVEELAHAEGVDSTTALKIRLALEETLVNIIEHGYPDDPDGRITVVCETPVEGIRLTVREKGIPYDADALKEDDEHLGMRLASYSVSEIHYANLGRDGREIVLVQSLPSKHVASLLPIDSKEKSPNGGASSPQPRTVTMRRLEKGDALEVSRCAYLSYGYAYEEFIYYPEQIIARNDAGRMLSVVAIGDDEHFMGHCALKRSTPDDALFEMGVLLVSPPYRGSGIALSLSQRLVEEGQATTASGMYVRAVAGHTISQHLAQKVGMGVCAIMLGVFPKNVEFKGLTGVVRDKMSSLVLWRSLRQPRTRSLFIPPSHREWIARIYDNLGLPWVDGDANLDAAVTAPGRHPEGHLVEILNIAEVEVPDASAAMLPDLRRTIRQLCLKGADAVYVFVNLEHPGTPAMVQALEKYDFFFSGVLPDRLDGCDAVVLQYLHSVEIKYDNLKLTEGIPNELLAHIRSLDPVNGV